MRQILKNGTGLLFRRQTDILSAAFVIMATYGLSHVVGLVKTRLLISQFFGSSSALLDVYYAAMVIPDTIFQLLIIGALSAAFIPTFSRYLARDKADAWAMASCAVNYAILLFAVVSLVIFALAPRLAPLIAPGFSPGQIPTLVSLLRLMLLAQFFFSISGFLTGIVQSHQRFLIPALAPVAYNLGVIAGTVFLSPTLGIFGPALGMVAGSILHVVIQLPLAFRLGFRIRFGLGPIHPGVREVARLMPPRTAALGIDQIEQFVAVSLASALAPGSLSLLNVARLLYAIPNLLFGSTIGQAALPALSQMAASGDTDRFRSTLSDSFLQVAFLALPASVLFIVLRIPIIRLAFGAKTFPWAATLLTGQTLAILAASAAFYAVMQLVIRGFYALHDTRTPLMVGLAGAIFDAVVSIVAVRVLHLGIVGLAAAISATAIIESLVLVIILSCRLGSPARLGGVGLSLAKMALVSLITGFALWLPMRLLDRFIFDTTRTLPLIGLMAVTSGIGLGVYLLLSFVFKIQQLSILAVLLSKLGRLKKLVTAPAEPLIVPAPDQN